jgi:hypothetical protein
VNPTDKTFFLCYIRKTYYKPSERNLTPFKNKFRVHPEAHQISKTVKFLFSPNMKILSSRMITLGKLSTCKKWKSAICLMKKQLLHATKN